MPPRSAKKAASQKPSPKAKKVPLAKSSIAPAEALPAVEEEKSLDEAAEAPPAAAESENDAESEQKVSLEPEGNLPEGGTIADAADAKVEDAEEGKVAAADVAVEESPEGIGAAEGAGVLVEDSEVSGKSEEGTFDEAEEVEEETEEVEEEAEEVEEETEAVEAEKHAEVVVEVKESGARSSKIDVEQGAKQSVPKEESEAAKVEDTETRGPEGGDSVGDSDKSGGDSDSDNEEDRDEIDPSVYMDVPMTERKRNKQFEIFVGGLGKDVVEDDLLKVFSEFGEIQSARIVKHPKTQRSRGFAFVHYATIEQAKKALAESKDGIEVSGKRAGVSASVDNDTLYLGNICKTWTKDQVLETLQSLGVDQIEEILLPDDPKNEGKNKGFAFLEFSSHSVAMAAFQRLSKPDAVFGCDRSAKVDFAQFSMHPSEEALTQVKTVHIEALPLFWDEEKVRGICKQYGEIENLQLSQNSNNKQKHFGSITFTLHESAVACVEGINDAQLGEGEAKVKANLATPPKKGRFAKQGPRGGFKITENGEMLKETGQRKAKGQVKDKDTHVKEKAPPKLTAEKEKKSMKFPKSHGKTTGGQGGALGHQKHQPQRDGKRGRKDMAINNDARPSKKARNDFNFRGRPISGFVTKRNTHFGKVTSDAVQPYASGSYSGAPGSRVQHSDLEPHAGYLPATRQARGSSLQRRAGVYQIQQSIGDGAYDHQQLASYGGYDRQHIDFGRYSSQHRLVTGEYNNSERIVADHAGGSVLQSYFPGYSTYGGHEAGYAYPRTGAYAPPQGPYYY